MTRRSREFRCGLLVIFLPLALAVGCEAPAHLRRPARYANGLVVVLPGIEGKSFLNYNIAVGLDEGGVRAAIEVIDWTSGVPGAFVYNLANLERNRREAQRIARRIEQYSLAHRGAPIHVIGHSGGGGVAILALESLREGLEVDSAILLAPALSPEYDLSAALPHARIGIYNFYSDYDVGALKVGTTLFGAVDREHGAAAGAVGFQPPENLDAKLLYNARLRQVSWTPNLGKYGANGTHMGWAAREFAREYLARMILLSDFDFPRATGAADVPTDDQLQDNASAPSGE